MPTQEEEKEERILITSSYEKGNTVNKVYKRLVRATFKEVRDMIVNTQMTNICGKKGI